MRKIYVYFISLLLILDLQGTILFANNAAARRIEADHCADLIGRNEGGRVVPKGEVGAMTAAMLELAASPDLRKKAGARNREAVVTRYGWKSSARTLLAVYEDLVSRFPTR